MEAGGKWIKSGLRGHKNLISISSRVGLRCWKGRERDGLHGVQAVDSPKVLPPPHCSRPVEKMRAEIERGDSHSLAAKADRENNNDLEIMRLLKRIIYSVKWR